jgi:hypothetical protein
MELLANAKPTTHIVARLQLKANVTLTHGWIPTQIFSMLLSMIMIRKMNPPQVSYHPKSCFIQTGK